SAAGRRAAFWFGSNTADYAETAAWNMFKATVTWALVGGSGSGGSTGGGSTQPDASLAVSNSSLAFGSIMMNTQSNVQTLTLTNSGGTGAASLDISSISLTGADAGQFAATLSTPVTLNAGATASVIVQFNPTSVGSKTATLQINHNAGGTSSPVSVTLTGQGVAPDPQLTFSTGTLNYGTTSSASTPLTLTITHTGSAGSPSVTINSIGNTNTTDFTVSGFSGPVTLTQGGTPLTLTVTFAPASTGTKTGTLSLSATSSGTITYSPGMTVALTGTKTVTRVTSGLQLLFDFENYNSGSGTAQSTGGAAGPVTLTATNNGYVSSFSDTDGSGIEISSNAVRLNSSSAPSSLISNLKGANAITIEAWIKPSSTSSSQDEAYVVSLADASSDRNFALVQDRKKFRAYLKTYTNKWNENDGTDPSTATDNVAGTNLMHVVYTYSGGTGILYVNGVATETQTGIGGGFSNWDDDALLVVANKYNSTSTTNDWQGKIYTIAIYNRALSGTEVDQNYQAGEE
ncbi:MAG: choice-of-anchor D domain-containing protein, partial [Anaerolineae bacterium]|nr:choice-of-anchor D domain-containing protein [Anaerolineae bacterium]